MPLHYRWTYIGFCYNLDPAFGGNITNNIIWEVQRMQEECSCVRCGWHNPKTGISGSGRVRIGELAENGDHNIFSQSDLFWPS